MMMPDRSLSFTLNFENIIYYTVNKFKTKCTK